MFINLEKYISSPNSHILSFSVSDVYHYNFNDVTWIDVSLLLGSETQEKKKRNDFKQENTWLCEYTYLVY